VITDDAGFTTGTVDEGSCGARAWDEPFVQCPLFVERVLSVQSTTYVFYHVIRGVPGISLW